MDIRTNIVQILTPLTSNLNAQNKRGETPIYRAALNGNTIIVKILAPDKDHAARKILNGVINECLRRKVVLKIQRLPEKLVKSYSIAKL